MRMLLRFQRNRKRWLIVTSVWGILLIFLISVFWNNSHDNTDYNTYKSIRYSIILTPNKQNRKYSLSSQPVVKGIRVSLEEYKNGAKTGNPLIDDYGRNDQKNAGENGHGVVLTVAQKDEQKVIMDQYRVNTIVSDNIPLNRYVPDSRIPGCDKLSYNESLPTATVILPFYDEWPSLLLRSVYSVINRSPRTMVEEIILVDDASTLKNLKSLEDYISRHFPNGLVRLIRLPERKGLINARMRGAAEARGEVLIFFDSHMEVNIDWLQPLLTEIARDKHRVPMATLDYIQAETFEYRYNVGYLTRYAWDWSMGFFETFFRDKDVVPDPTKPRPGVTMVGAAFAIDRKYFFKLGGYDSGMSIWGGENLEMAWRVSLCGGKLVHVPCSRVGHVARSQPYSFPEGRTHVEHFNYKRALKVWAGDYIRFVYSIHPDIETLDAGNLTERYAIRDRLKCKDFKWYIDNIWPELNIYDENALQWGRVTNKGTGKCLDSGGHLFQYKDNLKTDDCNKSLKTQGFTLTKSGWLRSSLQCVVAGDKDNNDKTKVALEGCFKGNHDSWTYSTKGQLLHTLSQRCLDIDSNYNGLALATCSDDRISQKWTFQPYDLSTNTEAT